MSGSQKARLVLRCARVRVAGASAVDVERPSGALDDLFRDHHLLDAFEARQGEHGLEQVTLHGRNKAARTRIQVDILGGKGPRYLIRPAGIAPPRLLPPRRL